MAKSVGLRLMLAFMGLFWIHTVSAALLAHLYEVQLPTQTQNEREWQVLCKQGLAQVFERTLGDPQKTNHPEILKAIEHAPDFVEQFRYEDGELIIKYSPQLIQDTAMKVGDTIWGQRRPNVVFWLAIEEQNERRLVGVESDPQLQVFLNQLATQKGIPLILPLMDLEDMAAITVTDVWGQFPSVLSHASERYNAQTMLLARLTKHANGEIEGQWQLYMGNQLPSWQTKSNSIEDALTQGIMLTVTHLKSPPQVQTINPRDVGKPYFIGVENINSSEHFRQVAHYLKTLDGVVDVRIQQIIGQAAVFEVTPIGRHGREAFEKALMMDGRLSAEAKMGFPAEVAMVYRWGGQPNTAFEIESVEPAQSVEPDFELTDEPAED